MKPDLTFPLEHAGWAALLVDPGTTICRANEAAGKFFGPAVQSGQTSLSAVWAPENELSPGQFFAHWDRSPGVTASLKFRVKGGGTVSCQLSICSYTQGEQKYYLLQVTPGVAPMLEGKGPQSEAAQKQKLECALQLARAVALDFNNALTGVMGHTSFLLSRAETSHPWRGSLLEIEKAATRAAERATDLEVFSRQDKEPQPLPPGNLNLLLRRALDSLQRTTPAGRIEWTTQFERKLFYAHFDEAKFQQALLKILENSLEAIPASGRITVQTRNLELTQPTQDRNVRLKPGAYVCVEISDTGSGIAAEHLPRVFEPFFTTKRSSSHRGLGLAWVYGIMTNHGGGVALSSQAGLGTSVRMYLPADKDLTQESGVVSDDLRGSETVLMVDDEEMLLKMGETILSTYGYHVLTASNGRTALEILSRNQPPVHLLITDLFMPGMSGRQLLERVQTAAPDVRILCTSGWSWRPSQLGMAPFLRKPYSAQDLLAKVRETLTAE